MPAGWGEGQMNLSSGGHLVPYRVVRVVQRVACQDMGAGSEGAERTDRGAGTGRPYLL